VVFQLFCEYLDVNVDGFGSVFSKVVADGGMVARVPRSEELCAEVHVQRSVVGQDAGAESGCRWQ
jgi:hypothetical protein